MPKQQHPKEEQSKALTLEIRKLRETLERLNKPSRRFYQGLISGVGTAIGATIIAAIVLYLLSVLFQGTLLETFIPEQPQDLQTEQLAQ